MYSKDIPEKYKKQGLVVYPTYDRETPASKKTPSIIYSWHAPDPTGEPWDIWGYGKSRENAIQIGMASIDLYKKKRRS